MSYPAEAGFAFDPTTPTLSSSLLIMSGTELDHKKPSKKGYAGTKERKRGRKRNKAHQQAEAEAEAEAQAQQGEHVPVSAPTDGQPSWISGDPDQETDPTAPFGFVDSDVKTYFKDLFAQLKASEATVI